MIVLHVHKLQIYLLTDDAVKYNWVKISPTKKKKKQNSPTFFWLLYQSIKEFVNDDVQLTFCKKKFGTIELWEPDVNKSSLINIK